MNLSYTQSLKTVIRYCLGTLQQQMAHIAISLDIPTLMSTLTTQRSGFQPIVLDSNNNIAHPMDAEIGTDWIQVPGLDSFLNVDG